MGVISNPSAASSAAFLFGTPECDCVGAIFFSNGNVFPATSSASALTVSGKNARFSLALLLPGVLPQLRHHLLHLLV